MRMSDDFRRRITAHENLYDRALTEKEVAALNDEMNALIKSIAAANSFDEADPLLRELGALQELLATLSFRFGVKLPHRMNDLVRELDRSDVEDERRRLFQHIQEGFFGAGRYDSAEQGQ
jgi:predicted  nucleic acid-binding Zn-ribbon protein